MSRLLEANWRRPANRGELLCIAVRVSVWVNVTNVTNVTNVMNVTNVTNVTERGDTMMMMMIEIISVSKLRQSLCLII